MSPSLKGSPHRGQNLGGLWGSSGSHPHLSHLYRGAPAGLREPQFGQNCPWFTLPQLQVQPSGAAGCGLPQLVQNLPVLPLAPHAQSQPPAAGWGAGFGLPQPLQKLPVLPVCPQLQAQPAAAAGAAAGAGCWGG